MAASSPDDKPISFRRLMALKQTGPDTFDSITPAWPPGSGTTAFGGHVYAQAAYAASKTIAPGFVIHNVTGHFILPGRIDTHFTYHVRRIRDGGVYCLRGIDVFQTPDASLPLPSRFQKLGQSPANTPCFVATVSFKRAERPDKFEEAAHQSAPPDHLRKTYAAVLLEKGIEDHPRAPEADTDWYDGADDTAFPGVEIRKVDMSAYNGDVPPGNPHAGCWRQLSFYRILLDREPDRAPDRELDLNLHACAHLYASDRNSLFLIQRALGYGKRMAPMASLSHTVVFHGDSANLKMTDDRGVGKWFVQEAWTSNSGGNRGCHESRLWDWQEGTIVAETLQDGMVRIPRLEEGRGRL